MAEERATNRPDHELSGGEVAWVLAGLVSFACVAWVVPASVVLMASGQVPDLGLVRAAGGAIRLVVDGLWSDPRSAYPAEARDLMPGGRVWWAFAGPVLLVTLALLRLS